MCAAAVASSGYALRWIPEALKTEDLCREAVESCPAVLRFVPKALQTAELLRTAMKAMEEDPVSLFQVALNEALEEEDGHGGDA
ncbi:MAG: hypothetical protein K6E40_00730 [Desulfovibrio sp.]|nr:hypothetical protein [Desulfovibrio sp.]